jgi:hypothetical protein
MCPQFQIHDRPSPPIHTKLDLNLIMSSFAPTVEEEEGSSPKLAWQEGEEFFPEISAIPYEGAD